MPTEPLPFIETDDYLKWVNDLSDPIVFTAVARRVRNLGLGNAGDAAPVGGGVSELRIPVGAGWRVYYVRRDDAYVLLCGGDKSTQKRDIERARALAEEV